MNGVEVLAMYPAIIPVARMEKVTTTAKSQASPTRNQEK